MNKASNKIVGFLAFILLASKGNAQEANQTNDEKLNCILSDIQTEAIKDPNLLLNLISMNREQLENELQIPLSDFEFIKLHALMLKLANEGVEITPKPICKIVIATQEYWR